MASKRKKYPFPCPQCGAVRNLTKRDGARAKLCQKCHLTKIAPLGYAATRDKLGEAFAVKFWRESQLANPSDLELLVMAALDKLGVVYEREYWLERGKSKTKKRVYLVDFAVNIAGEFFFIEVNGGYIHRRHEQRDAEKIAYIQDTLKAPLLILQDTEVKARYKHDREWIAAALIDRIARYLGVSIQGVANEETQPASNPG